MAQKQSSAFITTKKGTCYLTVKIGRRNYPIMRIYKYTIDAEDKRDMRRLHPDVIFDWKKITQQLAGEARRVPALPLPAENAQGTYRARL